jgi:hypothetical protein
MRRSILVVIAALACRKHAPHVDDAAMRPADAGPTQHAVFDDPMFHLRPEEASVTITPAHGAVGSPTHATLTIVPGSGFHLSKEFKARLDLGTGAAVATTAYSEQKLAFDITATPSVAGAQHLEGFLHVGVCGSESCRPRRHPIAIDVVGE